MHKNHCPFLKGSAASGNEWECSSFFPIEDNEDESEKPESGSHIKVKLFDTLRGSPDSIFCVRFYAGFEDTGVLALQANLQ